MLAIVARVTALNIDAQSSLSSAERLLLEQRVNLNLALGGNWEG